jgi:hypothetical protein
MESSEAIQVRGAIERSMQATTATAVAVSAVAEAEAQLDEFRLQGAIRITKESAAATAAMTTEEAKASATKPKRSRRGDSAKRTHSRTKSWGEQSKDAADLLAPSLAAGAEHVSEDHPAPSLSAAAADSQTTLAPAAQQPETLQGRSHRYNPSILVTRQPR